MSTAIEHRPGSEEAPAPSEPPRPSGGSNALMQLMRRFHFYAGILVGPFLLVAALTGILYALSPTMERVLHTDKLTASSAEQNVALSEQVANAQKSFPNLTLAAVVPGEEGATTRVLFTNPDLESSDYKSAAFVDPSNGEVKATSVVYGSFYAFPERSWIAGLHKNLNLGENGRIYSELAASWLAPITLAGLWLWWRQRKSRSMKSKTPRGKLLKRHSTFGVVAALGFLFLSATGLTWSTYAGENVGNLRTAMSWKTPVVSTKLPDQGKADTKAAPAAPSSGGEHEGHGAPAAAAPTDGKKPAVDYAPLTDVVNASRNAGLKGALEITVPAKEGVAWKVRETRKNWQVGPSSVAVNPSTGEVTDSIRFKDYPFAAKLTDWGVRLHMGYLFGILNQVILAVLAAGLAYIIIAGYRMWWLRRPTRNASFLQFGRAPLRGALVQVFKEKPLLTLLWAVVIVAVGWFVPLLGISLVAFAVIDLLLGLIQTQKKKKKV